MNPADLFSHETDTTNLAPGEVLFAAGDTGDCMYILLEGTLDIMVETQVVEQAVRGTIIGELALIDQSPRGATVVARSASRLAKVDSKRFSFLIQQNPYFAHHVMKVLADRIRHMNEIQAQSRKS